MVQLLRILLSLFRQSGGRISIIIIIIIIIIINIIIIII